ncbi:MAG TPA: hypothetical protein VD861_19090 [Pyrinomonadaceae bacterium]|nr:hypothetical protein [Pyrinomonadaceae bacterium]
MTDWTTELGEFYQSIENKTTQTAQREEQERLDVLSFFSNIVTPAFDELKRGFEQLGRRVETTIGTDSASIALYKGDALEYDLDLRTSQNRVIPVIPLNIIQGKSTGESVRFKKDFKKMTKEDLIQSFLNVYKNFISRHSG